jgi:hypothetical protein
MQHLENKETVSGGLPGTAGKADTEESSLGLKDMTKFLWPLLQVESGLA